MAFEIKGTISQLFDTKQVSDKFSKREFVLTTDEGKYSQTLLVQTSGNRISQLDGFAVGDDVNVAFNLRGREWKSPSGEVKYFVSVEAWKIERLGNGASAAGGGVPASSSDEGDIPFLSCSLSDEPSPIAKVLR